MDKQELGEAIRRCGFVRVEATFSGGNDEGGVDTVTGFRADDTRVDIEQTYPIYTWDPQLQRNTVIPREGANADHDTIWNGMSEPVTDRWSTFAGDFYVRGTVVYEVGGNPSNDVMRVWGDEEVSSYEPFSWDVS